ncbi:hypothetical protein TRFO_42050 [Tritrichomonas foetus]|uniref:Uncharacterized protein n=1 Tax=Tritrichomonas foetus TaxID=1144522 RepID=A0A1J4KY46_9EUKA|nr:hypothetical protein TRFO_42050 [Tritrichomonas foetus]|eukprot:OHT16090.1 hypothetical protein TRFO_42050 [Tritrichomonas foetus]
MTESPKHSFTRYKDRDKKKMYVKCNNFKIENGVRYICTYSKREDHHNCDIREGKFHKCKFESVSKQTTIDDIIKISSQKFTHTKESVLRKMLFFIGKNNLSLLIAESKELYELIIEAIQLGQENPRTAPTSLFKPHKRNSLTYLFALVADECHQLSL